MKNKDSLRKRIKEEEDFIYCPRLGNSMKQLLQNNPEGIDNERMSKVLLMTEEEIEKEYNLALKKLKEIIGL